MDEAGRDAPAQAPTHGMAARVAGLYGLFAVLWILGSSSLVALIASDNADQRGLEIGKGLAFVLLSTWLIHRLVRRGLARVEAAERSLREREHERSVLLGGVRDHALFQVDPHGQVREWNPGAERVLGWSAAGLTGLSWESLFTVEDRALGLPARLLADAAREGSVTWRGFCLREGGGPLPADLHLVALRRGSGDLYAHAVVIQDLTTHRQHDVALESAQRRLARTQSHGRIGHWTRDLADDRLELSESLHEIFGVTREQWGGNFSAFFERVHPDDRAKVGRAIQEAYEFQGTYDVRFRVLRPNGEERVLDAMGQVEFDAERRPLRVWGTALDITASHRVQQALEHSRAQLAGILDTAMDAIVSVDDQHRIVQFNRAAERLFGVGRGEALGTDLDRFIPPAGRAAHHAGIARLRAAGGGGAHTQVRARRTDGTEFKAEVSVSTLVLGDEVIHTAMLRDTTARDRADQQLRDYTARLERLSLRVIQVQEAERRHIARELHDEIGQTLTAAKLSVRQRLPGEAGDDTVAALDRVLQQVRTLSLDLRPSMLDDLGLAPTLRWLVSEQGRVGSIAAELVVEDLDERLPPDVETSAFRIVQEALTNVLRHAAASGVRVEVRRLTGTLAVSISDDGLGFDPQTQARNFGLQGMRERASLIGGRLEVESAPGRGTTVRALLPTRPVREED